MALTHILAPPIKPPEYDEENFEAQVDALHAEAHRQMEHLRSERRPLGAQ